MCGLQAPSSETVWGGGPLPFERVRKARPIKQCGVDFALAMHRSIFRCVKRRFLIHH